MINKFSANEEIISGKRFAFGENWRGYSNKIDESRIQQAVLSLQILLKSKELAGKTFLDVGSGSGLMSLAARRLGMHVVSFDYDPISVACTNKLMRKYFGDDSSWSVSQGSVLDKSFISELGKFDYVYSWGVIHHTGHMWEALSNLLTLVNEQGKIAIALYNDQGVPSKVWKIIKIIYNRLPPYIKPLFVVFIMVPRELRIISIPLLKGKFGFIWSRYKNNRGRGMSYWHDMVDWIGGYPFEVSTPDEVFYFFKEHGYYLTELKTCAGELGCNEYVFEKKLETICAV